MITLTCVDKSASVEINLKTGTYCPSYRGVRLIESRGNVTPLIRRKKRWTFSQLTRVCFRSLSWANLQTRVLHWDQAFWVGLVGSFRVLLEKKHFKRLIPIEHHLEVRCLFIYNTNVYCPKSKFTVRVSTCISVLKCFSRQKRPLSLRRPSYRGVRIFETWLIVMADRLWYFHHPRATKEFREILSNNPF